MMKTYKSIISCIAAAALLCCTACTDQWDEHYANQPGVNDLPTETLWELIKQDATLANFAEVCEATPFRTDETRKDNGYTFANLLGKPLDDGTVTNVALTVYAPQISDAQRDSILAIIKDAPNDSVRNRREWQVQSLFLANHIRRNRCDIMGKKSQRVYMLNSKAYILDEVAATINGVKVTTANIPAMNGVLHVLPEQLPCLPNLHEYLRLLDADNDFAAFVVACDTAIFLEGASLEGDPDEFGHRTYLDSVFYSTNRFFSGIYNLPTDNTFKNFHFKGLGMNLAEEDSMLTMIIPSSQAFNTTVDEYKKYYRYSDYYDNTYSLSNIMRDAEAKDIGPVRALPNAEDDSKMPEYLERFQAMQAQGSLMRQLTFNANMQYRGPRGDQNDVIDAFDAWKENGMVDSVGYITVNGDTLRALPYRPYYRKTQRDEEGNVYGINWELLQSIADDSKSFDPRSLFNGKQPVRMSNGLAYLVDELNYDTRHAVHTDFIVEAENQYNVYQFGLIGGHAGETVLGKTVSDSIKNIRGRISNGFRSLCGPNTNKTNARTVTFKLPSVLSAKYDIYIVTVPDYYQNGLNKDTKNPKPYQSAFTATLNYVDETYNETKQLAHKSTPQIAVDSSRVQTVLLFEDFEFPCSYAGVENTYPTLTITTQKGKTGNTATQTNNLCIDMIYLKAKE